MENLKCSKCQTHKPVSCFWKDKSIPRGYGYRCKDCYYGVSFEPLEDLPLTATQLAYLAALIDGEGCYSIYAGKNKYGNVQYNGEVRIQITSPVIKEIQQEYDFGKVNFREKKNPRHKPAWTWRFGKKELLRFLHNLSPYVRIKKNQFLLMLHFIKATTNKEKEILHQQMRELNYRGMTISEDGSYEP